MKGGENKMGNSMYQVGAKSGTNSGAPRMRPRPIKQSKRPMKGVGPVKANKTGKMTLS